MNFLLSLFICTAFGNTKQAGRVGGQQWESELLLKEDKKEIKRHLAMNPNNDLDHPSPSTHSIYVMEEEVVSENGVLENIFCTKGQPIRTLDECNSYLDAHKQEHGFENNANGVVRNEAVNEDLESLCFFQTDPTQNKIYFGSNYGGPNHRIICKLLGVYKLTNTLNALDQKICTKGELVTDEDECDKYAKSFSGGNQTMAHKSDAELFDEDNDPQVPACFYSNGDDHHRVVYSANYQGQAQLVCRDDCQHRDQESCSSHENCKLVEGECKFRSCSATTLETCEDDDRCHWRVDTSNCWRKKKLGQPCNDNKLCLNELECHFEDATQTLGTCSDDYKMVAKSDGTDCGDDYSFITSMSVCETFADSTKKGKKLEHFDENRDHHNNDRCYWSGDHSQVEFGRNHRNNAQFICKKTQSDK